mmetsp:Transcript_4759/g.7055  ORF Transcript_4759/g.7055 Transcript_4759/m.7055 type:complete len:101 (+) Transcript_4759:69-371(+)|eukprot:CAMPEP_0172418870 /NCGR_PEP_ID=MMETSP1064-20121228/5314_1 /TAXON_ID=202472 /ORGANISM="Aulacoseira subarctica , Strain CCAP 1002/5" /LENGTH=100 /DNA_ID=CAMNT_0013158009 /DNA_START=53 /DNA_END=355 /DNA_ORIENTATION=+
MKVLGIALKAAAVFGFVTSSAASQVHQENIKTTRHKDYSGAIIEKELNIDVVNKIQLEDQAFWDRSLSMSHLGDESYLAAYGGTDFRDFSMISDDLYKEH